MNRLVTYCLRATLIAILGIVVSSSSAQAQSGNWQVSIGTGVSYAPRYDGDAENQLRLVPLLDINYHKGKFFIGVTRGIGFNFSEVKYFQYGVRVLLGEARSQDADARLYGMGNIDYYPEGSLFFSTHLGFMSLSSSIASSDYGTHANVGGNVAIPLGEDDRFRLGATINWGDSIYNQTYFGVTAAQATASGNVLAPYNAAEGKKDTTLSASWVHNFDKSWFSTTSVSYKRLEGSAQLSPLTQRASMVGESLMLGYRF
jgi:outer membrane scaffolding protein for murein synthesis (MipA/OmpV family)